MRRAHFLKANHHTELPSLCVWVDTETHERRLSPTTVQAVLTFGWACFRRRTRAYRWTEPEWFRFTSPEQFWSWCLARTRARTKLYQFSHNQAFDFTVLQGWEVLESLGWHCHAAILVDPPTIIKFRREKSSLLILDTLNYFRYSAAQIGEEIGIPKLPMPAKAASQDEWDRYCKRDVEVIMQAVLSLYDFILVNDLGTFSHTLAAQSMVAYRHRFMPAKILIDDNEDALRLSRSAYLGGRVECYQLGHLSGKRHLLDINAQYPYVMRTWPCPTRLLGVVNNASSNEISEWLSRRCVVAQVTLDTDRPIYPYPHDGRLLFPVGTFCATLTTPELICALRSGHVKRIGQVAVYEREILFQEFVDTLYRLRQDYTRQGNQAFSWLCKIMMNSLYGKFGQTGRVYKEAGKTDDPTVKTWTEIDYHTGQRVSYRQFAGLIQQVQCDAESRDSHPAIAAHVTAYARQLLWHYMNQAGLNNVDYVDTDSLLMSGTGYDRMASSQNNLALGALKCEGVYESVELRGPKDYTLGDRVKIKGIRKNAEQIGLGVYRQDKFVGFKGMLALGDLGTMRIERITKHLARDYKKGIVHPSGLVTPWRLAAD